MTRKLRQALQNSSINLREPEEISGLLGLKIGGGERIDVPGRQGFVYVRLRDSLSEVIQARNGVVSNTYGLPVIVVRSGNTWRIKGRDTERYSSWGNTSSYLPVHGFTHELDRDLGVMGSDPIFLSSEQVTPLLVTPNSITGSMSLSIHPYIEELASGTFSYVGNSATIDFTPYVPTDANAIMGLVYANPADGTFGYVFNTGTSFSATITGSSAIDDYIPTMPDLSYLPLVAVRLVSGTTSLGWDNLYDVRQWFGGGGSGGGGTPGGVDKDVQFNDAGAFGGVAEFEYDKVENTLTIGSGASKIPGGNRLHLYGDGATPARVVTYSNNDTPTNGVPGLAGVRGGGTKEIPTQALLDMGLVQFVGLGYDNNNTMQPTQAKLVFIANDDFTETSRETRAEIQLTPSGATGTSIALTVYADDIQDSNGNSLLSSITVTAPLTGAGTPASPLAIPAATASVDGYATAAQIAKLDSIGAAVTWTEPTLLNSWVNYGSGQRDTVYSKDATGVIRVQGLVKNGTGGIFTLPTGMRPAGTLRFFARSGLSGLALIDVEPDGTVYVVGYEGGATNSDVDLSLISFVV